MFSSTYRLKNFIMDILIAIVATAVVGAGYAIFTVPNDIAPGGISGLATALAAIIPLSVGTLSLIMNVPLLLAAWKEMGIRPLVLTLISTTLLSFFIDFFGVILMPYTNDVLMASLYGGVLSGVGIGILFLRGLSTGGTDLLALLLRKLLPNVPSGTLLLIADATVVVIAMAVFRNLEIGLYSAITIFICSKVIDAISTGVDYAKIIYVVTDHGEEIAKVLMAYTDRGTTLVPVKGGFTGKEKDMVMIVTRRSTLAQSLRLVRQTDPGAFTFVVDSAEVHGEGFKQD